MTAKLTLTATVPPLGEEPMVVECKTCCNTTIGTGRPGLIWDKFGETETVCPDCTKETPSTRAVRYRVVATVIGWRSYAVTGLDFALIYRHHTSNMKMDGIEGLGRDCNEATQSLARVLVEAHRSGDPLPGVEITELEAHDETDDD